jgi:hypothetical protein
MRLANSVSKRYATPSKFSSKAPADTALSRLTDKFPAMTLASDARESDQKGKSRSA